MKILVLGANGKVGSRVAHELIARGHSVVAAIHNSKDNVPPEATLVSLDVTNSTAIIAALNGVDAVVCALSSWGSPDNYVLSSAMEAVIPAMQQAGVKRIVSVSGDVARLPGESSGLLTKAFHLLAFGPVRKVVEDSEKHLRMLYKSDLDWTVLRPTTMTSSENTKYKLVQTHPFSPVISRAAVVDCIVDLIETGGHIHKAPFITRTY